MKKIVSLILGVIVILGISIYENPNEFKSLLNIDLTSDSKVEVEKEINVEELLQNKEIIIDPCDLNGDRKANVKVDVGMDTNYANRDYYSYTNEYGQVVYIQANEIIAQNDNEEESYEKGDGRYCSDEAKVKGVEDPNLDEGHIIADSLGGTSNAYNITPQESQLNRYGTQSELEEEMRNALYNDQKVTDFEGFVYYKTTKDTIPTSYKITYKIDDKQKEYTFENN